MTDRQETAVESREVLRLFPTCLWKTQLLPAHHERLNSDLKESLEKLLAGKPGLTPGEHLQTDQTLHHLEEFKEFTQLVRATVTDVLDFLHVVYDSFEITGCWANIGAVNASHNLHSHPNNFLSGVYYVQTQEGANTISFEDPRTQHYVMSPRVTEFTVENSRANTINVKNGTLFVFPSWLLHSVESNRSDRERVSISFNIMFSSYAETMSAPRWKGSIDVDTGTT